MSKNISKNPQIQKAPKLAQEVRSAEDLCEQLNKLVQQTEWKIETAERFISLIINPNKQFQLNIQQETKVVTAILNCPLKYRAIVHLAIVAANFSSDNGLRTLDGISPKIINFISQFLDLKEGIQENILKNLGDKQVFQFIKEKIVNLDKSQKSIKVKEDDKKLDFLRNLISFLICEGEVSAIASRINIILEVLSDSNYYQQLTKSQPKQENDIKNRVKAVAELFKLAKPSASEAKRLLLYGSHPQIIASQQDQEISVLRENLQKEQELRKQREDYTLQLEQECQELKRQIIDAEKKLEQSQNDIEHQRELYVQLKTSSRVKISQEREATLSNVRNRLDHELNKLERCLTGANDNFQENSQIGLRIIKKIREQITG
ncbi:MULTISPECIES: hypothetical protein [Nostoc]|uniref:Uncharacterized protein n=2 Tax=Nostoc TaxID=1177 RepID=A0ABR8IGL0_9NOSO|nr:MULTISPECIES: hypothetical protein [Nostoc]MBD2565130.1 hypothetical protein [Nostoc linckia FACHB-391]MBD2650731.1 hypothetical protein [Nostoc foliaceum FACHB-393]